MEKFPDIDIEKALRLHVCMHIALSDMQKESKYPSVPKVPKKYDSHKFFFA